MKSQELSWTKATDESNNKQTSAGANGLANAIESENDMRFCSFDMAEWYIFVDVTPNAFHVPVAVGTSADAIWCVVLYMCLLLFYGWTLQVVALCKSSTSTQNIYLK